MIEVEIKVALSPFEPIVRRLDELGAHLEHPRSLEDNVLLDLEQNPLMARGAILRVRTYGGRASLTYKEPVSGPVGYKVRRELETFVPDPVLCISILEGAGFKKVWRYMKYRTVYRFGGLAVLVDQTPIGEFMELEGAREEIDAFAARIGKRPADYIVGSYRLLHGQWCSERGVEAGDMLFVAGTE